MPTHQGQPTLRGHGAFDRVFGEGKSFFLFPFQFRYKEPDEINPCGQSMQLGIRLGISVPKRRFKRAVDRNLIRRRIREAFRLNRQLWQETEERLLGGAAIVLVYSTNEILDFDRIQESLCKGMQRWSRSHRS
jgi:ribonuclease P protein component